MHVGVHVELTNLSGQTPLFCSSFLGHLEITKLLLKHGADPNRRCSIFSCTPVHAACFSGNVQVLSAVLVAGQWVYSVTTGSRSPFDLVITDFTAFLFGLTQLIDCSLSPSI